MLTPATRVSCVRAEREREDVAAAAGGPDRELVGAEPRLGRAAGVDDGRSSVGAGADVGVERHAARRRGELSRDLAGGARVGSQEPVRPPRVELAPDHVARVGRDRRRPLDGRDREVRARRRREEATASAASTARYVMVALTAQVVERIANGAAGLDRLQAQHRRQPRRAGALEVRAGAAAGRPGVATATCSRTSSAPATLSARRTAGIAATSRAKRASASGACSASVARMNASIGSPTSSGIEDRADGLDHALQAQPGDAARRRGG